MSKPEIMSASEFRESLAKKQTETEIQVAVCKYMKDNYPNVIFTCDIASGMNLGKKIGGMNTRLRSSRGIPDLFVAHPGGAIAEIYKYRGLFIELKRNSVRLKNGGIAKTEHHDEQQEILRKLGGLGYNAVICCGVEEAKIVIDKYLKP